MRINLDIQSAIGQRTGVGNYTALLSEALCRLTDPNPPDLRFFYFDFKKSGHSLHLPPATERAVRWCPGRVAQQCWKRLNWPPYEWFAGKSDVYHFPNFIIPPLHIGKAVVTIHDLAFLRMPETIESKNLAYLSARIRQTVSRADAIIAVSRFTAEECQSLLEVPEDRIFTVHEGLGDLPQPTPNAADAFRRKIGVDGPFLLSVGTLEPRKNYPFLIDVFDRIPDDISLVIAGGPGWKYEPILERINQSPKADRIKVTGYLSRDELAAAYSEASLFVYPTRYEGFGFPPLEAMHYGLPVLAARVPPLPEVLGSAAAWAEPDQLEDWSDQLSALLADQTRQQNLVKAGHSHIKQYSWEKAAQQTLNIYQKVAE